MITPLDIENRNLNKFIYGYKVNEVDEFINKINEDYECLYKENIELKDKVSVLNEGISHYKLIEDTLQNTLLVAQKTAEDIKRTASERSDLIIKEAEFRAQQIIDEANRRVIDISREYETLKKEFEIFKTQMKVMIKSQLGIIDSPSQNNVKQIENNEEQVS